MYERATAARGARRAGVRVSALMRTVAIALVAVLACGCASGDRSGEPAAPSPAPAAPAPADHLPARPAKGAREPVAPAAGVAEPATAEPSDPPPAAPDPAGRPYVRPAPTTEVEWDQWFDERGRQVAEWLARPETWRWPDEQLADWLEVHVHTFRSEGQPYRWVQFGPVRRAVGTLRPSQYWVQWEDDRGAVRSQALDPMDSGLYRGHRVFVTEEGRRLLVALLESVIAPNAASVWVWELDGGEWRPLADAFSIADREVLPGVYVSEVDTGGLDVSQVFRGSPPPPHVEFREGLASPHFTLCGAPEWGRTSDCITALWAGDRFLLEAIVWGAAPRPMECRLLAPAGAAEFRSGDFAWAEAAFGEPARRNPYDYGGIWEYPEQGLEMYFSEGSLAWVIMTQGGLASGLQVGDTLVSAIELHGRPYERPDGEQVWAYQDCGLKLSARVAEERIAELKLVFTHLE